VARAHLAAGRVAAARAAADVALARRPADAELLLLRGEALHRLGQIGEGIEAYAAASAVAPLDRVALRDLVQDLGRERTLADRAARVLRDAGPAALPAVLAVAKDGAPSQRLRALTLLRDVGSEEQVDRVAAYGALLAEPDCDLRRAAAHRLGEIGDRAALPRLRELAAFRKETKGFLGMVSRSAACGASEAAEAAKRIEALNR
jgi:eukaryotic-like serine/threonine-protein kinase